jgi:L-amino acid N-acyltransferase YncA
VNVRRAALDDAPAIAAVHVQAWQAAYKGIVPAAFLDSLSVEERTARWRQNLAEGASTVCVAEASEGVVGWASVGACRDADATAATGELWAIYVAPGCWRHGVGRAMWAWGQSHLEHAGFTSAVVWVLEDNRSARRFYARMGFASAPDATKMVEIGGVSLPEVRLRAPRLGAARA